MNKGDEILFVIRTNNDIEKIPAIYHSPDPDDENLAIIQIDGRLVRVKKTAIEIKNKENHIICKKCNKAKKNDDFSSKKNICNECMNEISKNIDKNEHKRKKIGKAKKNQALNDLVNLLYKHILELIPETRKRIIVINAVKYLSELEIEYEND